MLLILDMNFTWTKGNKTWLYYRSEENGGGGREIDTLGPEGTVCASMDNIWSNLYREI